MNVERTLLLLILNETVSNATRLDQIMSDQDQLNADVTAEGDLLTTVESEIASLKAQPAAANLDFSGVDKMLSRLKGDAAAAAPPVAAPPAPAQQPAGTPAQPAQAPAATPAEPAAAATAPATPPVATDVNGVPVQPPAPGEAPAPVQQAPAVNGGIGGATTPPSQSAPPQVQSAPPATQ